MLAPSVAPREKVLILRIREFFSAHWNTSLRLNDRQTFPGALLPEGINLSRRNYGSKRPDRRIGLTSSQTSADYRRWDLRRSVFRLSKWAKMKGGS